MNLKQDYGRRPGYSFRPASGSGVCFNARWEVGWVQSVEPQWETGYFCLRSLSFSVKW